MVGLNLQEKRRNHADGFLSADVSLQTFDRLKKALVSNLEFVAQGPALLYFLLNFCLTYRLRFADQELVELLQQGRLPNNLPAHVGVPGLLIRIPGGQGHIKFYPRPVSPSWFDNARE